MGALPPRLQVARAAAGTWNMPFSTSVGFVLPRPSSPGGLASPFPPDSHRSCSARISISSSVVRCSDGVALFLGPFVASYWRTYAGGHFVLVLVRNKQQTTPTLSSQ